MSLLIPLPAGSYRISSPYGARTDPITGKPAGHNGLDMAAPTGTPILAAADGVVTNTYSGHSFNGNGAILKHEGVAGVAHTAYIHMDRLLVSKGQSVRRGQQIGTVGETGRATGPHLHFIVYAPGWKTVDPQPLIRSAGAVQLAGGRWGRRLGLAGAFLILLLAFRRVRRRRRARRATV